MCALVSGVSRDTDPGSLCVQFSHDVHSLKHGPRSPPYLRSVSRHRPMSRKMRAGSLELTATGVKAQALAWVDVPTAPHFFLQCGLRSPRRMYSFLTRIPGYVHDRQPTMIL